MTDVQKLFEKDQAEAILDRDKDLILSLFLPITQKLIDSETIDKFFKTRGESLSFDFEKTQKKLPDGWIFEMVGNLVSVHYMDSAENELDKSFFVPSINISYSDFINTCKAEEVYTDIIERLQIGFCSCGEKMVPLHGLAKAASRIEKGGILNKVIAYPSIYMYSIYIKFSPKWQMALTFNRHPKCL